METVTAYDIATDLFYMVKDGIGGTVADDLSALPVTGYWIGGEGSALVYDSVDAVDRGEIGWWVGNNAHASYYGVWVDQEDGKVYFDAVTHMYNLGPAMDLGAVRGEKAIWEIHNSKEIRLP